VVTADAFDPAQLGVERRRRPLERLLVTGDSMAMPLDVELLRSRVGRRVREPGASDDRQLPAGRARVYWLTLPSPKDADRARIAHTVNAAIRVAAEPYRAQVRVLDMTALFTPGERYRAAMTLGGAEAIVRESDGIHLNDAGARLAADRVLKALDADFTR
jgi:hypothetical protein